MSADYNPGNDEFEELGSEGEPLELTTLLHTALDRGVVLHGDVTIAIADIDLIQLNLGLLLSAIATIERNRPSTAGRPALDRPTLAGALGPLSSPPVAGVMGRPPSPGAATAPPTLAEAPPAPPAADEAPAETSLNAVARGLPERINADAPGVESGLARLVLTLIEVLRKVLEHQAVRRMDGGRLSAAEIERLGLALSRLNDRMQELKQLFGLSDRDLEIDLGPLGRLR